jgi:hypothetical protein
MPHIGKICTCSLWFLLEFSSPNLYQAAANSASLSTTNGYAVATGALAGSGFFDLLQQLRFV